MAHAHLFQQQAALGNYNNFRPHYPDSLYKIVLDWACLPQLDTALDVATGSGQAAAALAKRFKHVIAIDPNPDMLKHAAQTSNIEYRVGTAEDMQLPAATVDLVTVAQGMHWFELDEFYREARHVLKPSGCLAAWGYNIPEFPDRPDCTQLMQKFFQGETRPYWSDRRDLVDTQYQGLEPDKSIFSETAYKHTEMSQDITIAGLCGYLRTWSGIRTYLDKHPERADPVDGFQRDFMAASGLNSDQDKVAMVHPVFIMLCKN